MRIFSCHQLFFLIIIFYIQHQEIIDAWQYISPRHYYYHNNQILSRRQKQKQKKQNQNQTIRPFPFRHVDSSSQHVLLYSVTSSGNDNNHDEDDDADYHQGGGGDPVLRLPLMEAKLATLMEEEEGKQQQQKKKKKNNNNNNLDNSIDDESTTGAAKTTKMIIEKLQTDISNAKTSAEFGVRKSQSEFYDAFATGNIDAMSKVWSDISPIRCVHPGMSSINGRQNVMESWKQIFHSAAPPTAIQQQQSSSSSSTNDEEGIRRKKILFEIEPSRTQIDICGGLTAICSCIEKTQGGGELEVINIYKRENGCWKMTLHHAGPVVMRSSSSSGGGGGAMF